MPTQKIFQTTAEKSGITSEKDKAKEIKAIAEPKVAKVKVAKVKAPEIAATVAPVVVKPERKKRILSEEQKDVLRERLVKAREARVSKRKILGSITVD